MSFVDLEAGTLPRSPLPLSQKAAHAVFQINTKVGALRHIGDALGTPKDTPALRRRLRATRAEAARLAKIASQTLKQAAETADDDGAGATQRIDPGLVSKMSMDFEAALRDLQQVLQRIVAAERQVSSAAAADGGTLAGQTQQQLLATAGSRREDHVISAAGCGTLTGQTQQQLLATEREHHDLEALVNERELGILEAEQAIADIKEIFVDLAKLVKDQGGRVDHVVRDIEGAASATTSQAAEEVTSGMAETPASRSSNPCLLMFILALFLIIIVLVIV